MFIVIILSLVVSAATLMLESEVTQTQQSNNKQEILAKIKNKYFGDPNGPREKYQEHLRNAALARSQGDTEREAMYYRKVLHLLNAINRSNNPQGVTGITRKTRNDSSLKSDEELQDFLHALLNNNGK